jgi:hypothetical protein
VDRGACPFIRQYMSAELILNGLKMVGIGFRFRVMLKEKDKNTKRESFYIEKCIFYILKDRLYKFQHFYILFSSLTSVQGH